MEIEEDGIAEDVAVEVACKDLHEAMSAVDDAAPSLDNIGLDFLGDRRKTLGSSMGSLGYIDFAVPVGNVDARDSFRKDSGERMPICGSSAVRRIFWGVTGAGSKAFPSSPLMFHSCSELDRSVSVPTAKKGHCKCICETNHGDLHVSTKGQIRNSNNAYKHKWAYLQSLRYPCRP